MDDQVKSLEGNGLSARKREFLRWNPIAKKKDAGLTLQEFFDEFGGLDECTRHRESTEE
jgi:hypothetical protein